MQPLGRCAGGVLLEQPLQDLRQVLILAQVVVGLRGDPQDALADVIAAAESIAGIRERTGRDAPDVIT